jgi:hypothetical protein
VKTKKSSAVPLGASVLDANKEGIRHMNALKRKLNRLLQHRPAELKRTRENRNSPNYATVVVNGKIGHTLTDCWQKEENKKHKHPVWWMAKQEITQANVDNGNGGPKVEFLSCVERLSLVINVC